MSKLRIVLLIALAAMVTAAGCGLFGTNAVSQPELNLDEVVAIFNADLGDEGSPVGRVEVEEAFQDDPELRSAVQRDLADALPASQ